MISNIFTVSDQNLDDLLLLTTTESLDVKLEKFRTSMFYVSLANLHNIFDKVTYCIPSNVLCSSNDLIELIIHESSSTIGVAYVYDKETDAFYFKTLDTTLYGMKRMYELILKTVNEDSYYKDHFSTTLHQIINNHQMLQNVLHWFKIEYMVMENLTSLLNKKMKL